MAYLNIEIKAVCKNPEQIRNWLLSNNAEYRGTDEQTDTYFNTNNGRLKLRQGNIENNLIYYERDDQPGPKQSHFSLVKINDAPALKDVLTRSLGIKVIVKKKREIYYIKNVKFHLDEVPGLGSFVEVEAGNLLAPLTKEELQVQCDNYIRIFGIQPNDMISTSYSDMLIADCGLPIED